MNPLKKYAQSKEAQAEQRKKQELQQLNLWKETKDPTHLEPLVQAFEPLMNQKMKQWKAPAIPEAAFKAELSKHLVGAFESFDPSRGAALNTHVENRLRKAMRYNAKYQNAAHIPEGQIEKIAPIQQAHQQLHEQFGRAPSPTEVSQYLQLPVSQVKRVLQSQRKDILSSSMETDPQTHALSRDAEVLNLLPYSLKNDQEKQVFSHLYGEHKQDPPLPIGTVAKNLGLSSSQISRIHSSILNQYKKYK